MPKLTEKQRREIREDIKSGEYSKIQIMQKYNISERQVQIYLKKLGLNKTQGRPSKEKEVLKPEVVEEQNVLNVQKEEVEEAQETPKVEKQEIQLDENKDYCAGCYRSGKITEVRRGIDFSCPLCKDKLAW